MIIGKILAYSDETGNGTIISEDRQKYRFDVSSWNSFDSTPTVGMRVAFVTGEAQEVLEVDVASDVETYDREKSSLPESDTSTLSVEESPQTVIDLEADRVVAVKEDAKEVSQKEIPKKQNPAISGDDLGMKSCIDTFFAEFEDAIAQDKTLRLERKELDFMKMKRFLYTAYNNLLEIDTGFENYILADIKDSLDRYYELYRRFEKQTKYMKTTFEKVFLQKQDAYKKLKVSIEINKKELSNLKHIVQTNESDFESEKKRLKEFDPKSTQYKELYQKLKQRKRRIVDGIHEATKIREENRELIEQAERFYDINYTPFEKLFQKKSKNFKESIVKILNVLAYRLDSVIWQNANESESVKLFFKNAGIKTRFSSATYLRYYINSLDMTKLNSQNHELLELLHYLEKKEQSSVVIFVEAMEEAIELEKGIKEIKDDTKTAMATRESILMRDLKKNAPSILILDPLMRGVDSQKVVSNIRYIYPRIDIVFWCESLTKNVLLLAKEFRVSVIFQKSESAEDMKRKIEVMLEQ
ncbi:MAG: hypothetical protein ACQESH_01890 [Campylobacterota bacterium]